MHCCIMLNESSRFVDFESYVNNYTRLQALILLAELYSSLDLIFTGELNTELVKISVNI